MQPEVLKLFKAIQNVQLATCEAGQPRLRPMTLIVKDGRFFFATDTEGGKSAQIAANPQVECCLLLPETDYTGYVRLSGSLQAQSNIEVKKDIADYATFIYQYWKDEADPGYCLYELVLKQVRYMKPGEMLEEVTDY